MGRFMWSVPIPQPRRHLSPTRSGASRCVGTLGGICKREGAAAQRDVRERLRVVGEQATRAGVVFLGDQAEVVPEAGPSKAGSGCMIVGMKVLVTGGTGFLGSHVVAALAGVLGMRCASWSAGGSR